MDNKKKVSTSEKSAHFVKVRDDGSKKETSSYEKESKAVDKDILPRKCSIDKDSKECESHFVADISMPGDLPLPTAGSDLGHNRKVADKLDLEKKLSVDKEFEKLSIKKQSDKLPQTEEKEVHSWASVAASKPVEMDEQSKQKQDSPKMEDTKIKSLSDISASHDKIVRGPESIVSLGPVEGKDKYAGMQGFQKELSLESKAEKVETISQSKPASDIGIKSLGPVKGSEFSQISGFQKDLTLGDANAQRPEVSKAGVSLTQHTDIKTIPADVSITQHTDLKTIPEVSEKKGLLTRAVESIAAAAGTVAGVLTPTPSADLSDVPAGVSKSYDYYEKTEISGDLSGQDALLEEKGLVDSAIEKVWNVLTGKEELFPQPEQTLQRSEVELEINAPQQQIIPVQNVEYSAQQFIPGQEFIPQQRGLDCQQQMPRQFMSPQEQYLYEQQQLQFSQMPQQQQYSYIQQQPQFMPQQQQQQQQQMEYINQQHFAPQQPQFQNQFMPQQQPQQFRPQQQQQFIPQQQQQFYESQQQQQFDQSQMNQQYSSKEQDMKQFQQMEQLAAQRGVPLQKTVVEEKTVKTRITTLPSAGDGVRTQPDYEAITQQRREM